MGPEANYTCIFSPMLDLIHLPAHMQLHRSGLFARAAVLLIVSTSRAAAEVVVHVVFALSCQVHEHWRIHDVGPGNSKFLNPRQTRVPNPKGRIQSIHF